jgi:hypothetical protein
MNGPSGPLFFDDRQGTCGSRYTHKSRALFGPYEKYRIIIYKKQDKGTIICAFFIEHFLGRL